MQFVFTFIARVIQDRFQEHLFTLKQSSFWLLNSNSRSDSENVYKCSEQQHMHAELSTARQLLLVASKHVPSSGTRDSPSRH